MKRTVKFIFRISLALCRVISSVKQVDVDRRMKKGFDILFNYICLYCCFFFVVIPFTL